MLLGGALFEDLDELSPNEGEDPRDPDPISSESANSLTDLEDRLLNDRVDPPISSHAADTIFINKGVITSAHGIGHRFIRDEEILIIDASRRELNLEADSLPFELGSSSQGAFSLKTNYHEISVFVYQDSKHSTNHLIQQQAVRACVPTAQVMVMLDACAKHNVRRISDSRILDRVIDTNLSQLGDLGSLYSALGRTGLIPEMRFADSKNPLDDISDAIRKFGSIAIGINGEIGSHVIVISDMVKVAESYICNIRDPYHGWAIRVFGEALLGRTLGKEFLVIRPE